MNRGWWNFLRESVFQWEVPGTILMSDQMTWHLMVLFLMCWSKCHRVLYYLIFHRHHIMISRPMYILCRVTSSWFLLHLLNEILKQHHPLYIHLAFPLEENISCPHSHYVCVQLDKRHVYIHPLPHLELHWKTIQSLSELYFNLQK